MLLVLCWDASGFGVCEGSEGLVSFKVLLRGAPGSDLPVLYSVLPLICQITMWATDKSKYMSRASVTLIHWNGHFGSQPKSPSLTRKLNTKIFLTQITWIKALTILSLCAKGRLNARKAYVTNQNRFPNHPHSSKPQHITGSFLDYNGA